MREYPEHVHIETTGYCNSHCRFCPHSRSTRRNKHMETVLFDKILRELEEIPGAFLVSPFKLGEPLLDPLICSRLLQINEQLPRASIKIHTNLNYLPPGFIDTLKQLDHLAIIWVSLNCMTVQDYRDETGLNLPKTLANLQTLIDSGLSKKIVVGRVLSNASEDQQWATWIAYKSPGVRVKGLPRASWCSNISTTNRDRPKGPCALTHELSICCDGRVALCCMDGLCEYPLGDVTKDNCIDVYNGPKAKAMRTMKRRKKPCSSCILE